MSILDNAKEVANAVHEIKNLELYEKVLHLTQGIMELVQENRNLHTENHELKEKLSLVAKMGFKEPFYYQEGDTTPFCPACWEGQRKAIHLKFTRQGPSDTYYYCPNCRQPFIDVKDRSYRPSPPERGDWPISG